MEPSDLVLWTVGHSNHSFEKFLALLARQRLQCIVDVRSYPYSKFAPQFNREDLFDELRRAGLRYLFLGDELGGRPATDAHYDAEGHALYELMAQESAFQHAVDRLLKGAGTLRLALLCSEGQPQDCHRRLLVGRVLVKQGVELRHILPDGSVRVETSVSGESSDQPALFGDNSSPWRSTQSVSHRRRLNASSAA